MVIHGATDGYSRGITYLHCSTNNQAQTVLTLFHDTIVVYGLPSHVRGTHCRENVVVARLVNNSH